MAVFFVIAEPLFGSSGNLQNLASQSAVLAMVAAGQLFAVLGGGIDLSVGAQVGLLSIIAVDLSHILPLGLVFLATLAVGCLVGLINGLAVTRLKISPIIATVAMLQILTGVNLAYTKGLPRRNFDPLYTALGTQKILGLPIAAILAVVVAIVAAFVLRRTVFGRYTYAIGGNSDAALLSGINVRSVKLGTYVVCSLFAALGALTLSSRTGSGIPDLGSGLEITSIAAVFIGGIAWGGGRGTVLGAMLGVILIAMLGNGLDLLSVQTNVQTIVTGILMAAAVALTQLRRGSRA
ncbi:sugar ABC transporter permease [Pseudonocardia ailaonensis]|uniref:Autoinducer 2 import system permease protein LsrD n=1 Tax=Pseudonocardia ailaonensis TaxID=367279 RepID=A0ABN2NCD2_9PSEU